MAGWPDVKNGSFVTRCLYETYFTIRFLPEFDKGALVRDVRQKSHFYQRCKVYTMRISLDTNYSLLLY